MNAADLAGEWLKYSKSDLITAKHMFEDVYPKETEIVCYHCQQCVEKALKGYCLSKNIEPLKTHDLIALCQMCIIADNSFYDILDNCSRLNLYGVSARYPNELAIDEAIAKNAILQAQQVYDFCCDKTQF